MIVYVSAARRLCRRSHSAVAVVVFKSRLNAFIFCLMDLPYHWLAFQIDQHAPLRQYHLLVWSTSYTADI